MSAGIYDFKIEQGVSFTLSLVYKDSNGDPIDLTGWCGRLIWKNNNGTQIFHTGTSNSEYRFIIDEPNGKIVLQFPATTTNDFNFSSAKYDLELQSPDNFYTAGGKFTTRLLYGTINIDKRFSQNNDTLECNL